MILPLCLCFYSSFAGTESREYFHCNSQTKQKLLIFSLLFVILVLFAAIGVLMYLKNSESSNPDSAECAGSESSSFRNFDFDGEKVCSSESCVKAAAEILNSIDAKVDPCQDFYGFVCNGWIQNNPIPKVGAPLYYFQEFSRGRFFEKNSSAPNPINKIPA